MWQSSPVGGFLKSGDGQLILQISEIVAIYPDDLEGHCEVSVKTGETYLFKGTVEEIFKVLKGN